MTVYINGVDQTGLGQAGEGHVTILPLSYDSIGQGTWIVGGELTAHYLQEVLYNSSTNDGDNISYKVYLEAGTYTLLLFARTTNAYGIVDIDIDAGEVASFDQYSASPVENVRNIQTAINVATAGIKTLKVRVDGKNGSSSGYSGVIGYIALWRTA